MIKLASLFHRGSARLAPVTASGGLPMAVGAGFLALSSLWLTLWALAPALLAHFGGAATLTGTIFGNGSSAWASAAIFDIVALLGLPSLARSRTRLAREEIAAKGAQQICLEKGPALLKTARPGQSPFFSGGYNAVPQVETTAAFAMAENIRKDAESYRYEPIAMILDRVAGRLVAGTGYLRDIQQLGLRLGILGTFFGMAMALVKLNGMFAPDAPVEAGRNAISAIVDQVYLAFGTSIAGLISAVLLQITAWGLRTREIAAQDLFQNLAAAIQALYRSAEMGQSIGLNMDLLKDEIVEHRRDMASQQYVLGDYTRAMEDATREAAHVFEKPLDAIRNTGERLSALLAEQDSAMKSLGDTARSVATLQEQVSGHFGKAISEAGEVQKAAFAALKDEITIMATGIHAQISEGFQSDDRFTNAEALEKNLSDVAALLRETIAQQKRGQRLHLIFVAATLCLFIAGAGTTFWFSVNSAPVPESSDHAAR